MSGGHSLFHEKLVRCQVSVVTSSANLFKVEISLNMLNILSVVVLI
jgi:hypothetical protein